MSLAQWLLVLLYVIVPCPLLILLLCCTTDILRKYPARAPDVIPSLHRCLKSVEDAEGKVILFHYCGHGCIVRVLIAY